MVASIRVFRYMRWVLARGWTFQTLLRSINFEELLEAKPLNFPLSTKRNVRHMPLLKDQEYTTEPG